MGNSLHYHSLDIEYSLSRLITDFHLVCRKCGKTWGLKPKYYLLLSALTGVPYIIWPLIVLALWVQLSSPAMNLLNIIILLAIGIVIHIVFLVLPPKVFCKMIMKNKEYDVYFYDFVNAGCKENNFRSNEQ